MTCPVRPTVLVQPGPVQEPRIVAVAAHGQRIRISLRRGHNLLAELTQGLAARGFASGVAQFADLKLGPFAYVRPALSATGANAAWYSDTFRPTGVSVVESGAITVGTREGVPFYHCHAIWRQADGSRAGGHFLPDDTVVAADHMMDVLALDGAVFDARYDPETNFKLMGPVAMRASHAAQRRVVALRLRPNQDLIEAIEAAAAAHGITHARIAGGVGSMIGAEFADGTVMPHFATEVFVVDGHVAPDASGTSRAELTIGLVDDTGALATGRVVRGINPVSITFELVLESITP